MMPALTIVDQMVSRMAVMWPLSTPRTVVK